VVRSAIGEYPLCLGGEVDCVEGECGPERLIHGEDASDMLMAAEVGADHPGLHKCMELKTNKVIENERQEAIFHKCGITRLLSDGR
jgi:RAT1-interacting protein